MMVEREEFLSHILPELKKIGFTDGHLYIKDGKRSEVATVGLDDKGYVYCQFCKKIDCPHTLYAVAMIEVIRLEPLPKKK